MIQQGSYCHIALLNLTFSIDDRQSFTSFNSLAQKLTKVAHMEHVVRGSFALSTRLCSWKNDILIHTISLSANPNVLFIRRSLHLQSIR